MATKLITVHFTSAGVPALGLTPTINIYNAQTNVLLVSGGVATEISDGWYKYVFAAYNYSASYVFVFDGGAGLTDYDRYKHGGNDSYTEDITTTVLDEPVLNHIIAGSVADTITKIKADTTSIFIGESTIVSLVDTLLKYSRNKTKIDTVNAQLIIYDNDEITPLTVFNLLDSSGLPSVQEVCQRVPI